MKKITRIILFFMMTVACDVYSQDAPISTIGSIVSNTGTATVPVTATGFSNVDSWSLWITYDPAVVSVSSVTPGTLLGGYLSVNLSNSGQIHLSWFTSAGITLPDNTVILNIVFAKVSLGTSSLVFLDNGFSCEWYSGAVTLNDSPYASFYLPGSITFGHNAPVTTLPAKLACEGKLIHVPVIVKDFNNIGSVSLTMNYTSSVLTYQSWTNSSGFQVLQVNGSTPGQVVIGGYSYPGTTYADNATLLTLDFIYHGGSTDLTWMDNGISCEYADSPENNVLNDLPYETYYINGSVGPANMTASAFTVSDVSCYGQADGIVSASVTGGTAPYSFLWSTTSASQTISGLAPATYTVTVTDATGCEDTRTTLVTQPGVLTAGISNKVDVTTYGGSDGSLTVSASGGTTLYSYLWNSGQSTAALTGLTAGNYTVTVTDAHSCTATASAEVSQPLYLCLKCRVFLGGAYNPANHLMRDDLRTHHFLPDTEPYSGYPYYFHFTHHGGGGGETVTDTLAVFGVTGQNAIVDWVFVELRNKSNKSQVMITRSALVQRDGDVVGTDGSSKLCFYGLTDNQYYVAIRHRNHLGVMTAGIKTLTSEGAVVDFTNGSEPEFNWGTSCPTAPGKDFTGLSQSTPETGVKALWFGDTDNNHKVKYEAPNDDQSIIQTDVLFGPGNTTYQSGYGLCNGYYAGDVDLNGKAKFEAPNDDRSLILYQVLFYPLNTTHQSAFDFLLEQLP